MYAATSLRDAYRKLKKTNDGYLLAFGQGEFFVFVLGDANQIVRSLPDVQKWDAVDYAAVRVHTLQFFQFCARLKACGLKVAMVGRKLNGTKVSYVITGRSDE